MSNQVFTKSSIYIKINESEMARIIQGIKKLDESGINYEILEEHQLINSSIQQRLLAVSVKDVGNKGIEIIEHLYLGHSYDEIAELMGISINGVRYYIKKIYRHFGISNSRDAIRMYLEAKLT